MHMHRMLSGKRTSSEPRICLLFFCCLKSGRSIGVLPALKDGDGGSVNSQCRQAGLACQALALLPVWQAPDTISKPQISSLTPLHRAQAQAESGACRVFACRLCALADSDQGGQLLGCQALLVPDGAQRALGPARARVLPRQPRVRSADCRLQPHQRRRETPACTPHNEAYSAPTCHSSCAFSSTRHCSMSVFAAVQELQQLQGLWGSTCA